MKRRSMTIDIPNKLISNPTLLVKSIDVGMRSVAEAIAADFDATTNTWRNQPTFTVTRNGYATFRIATTDRIWGMLNAGTRPHIIRPRRAKMLAFRWGGKGSYKGKTKVRWLGSKSAQYPQTWVYRRIVRHPGTEARDWIGAVADKYDTIAYKVVQRAIDGIALR